MKAAAKPMMFHVVPGDDGRWVLHQGRRAIAAFDTREGAIREGKVRCQASARLGLAAELMVHDVDGGYVKLVSDVPKRQPVE
jgi:hypothetical protein